MMRHFFSLARPPPRHLGGVHLPSVTGLPIPLARPPQRLAPCLTGAAVRAVDLSAIAAAADHDLRPAPATQKKSAGQGNSLARVANAT
jgi:hypothetical protein